jgi:MinD-like ATPase involved in chromosome partitioning or flagellar assembly
MITPTEFAEQPLEALQGTLERIGAECGPCDVVVADLEAGTPDEKVRWLLACCAQLSRARGGQRGR